MTGSAAIAGVPARPDADSAINPAPDIRPIHLEVFICRLVIAVCLYERSPPEQMRPEALGGRCIGPIRASGIEWSAARRGAHPVRLDLLQGPTSNGQSTPGMYRTGHEGPWRSKEEGLGFNEPR